MEEPEFILYAELSDWPSKAALAALLRAEGFGIDVGRQSIRLQTECPFVFRELDLPEPRITADSDSLKSLDDAAAKVSWALAKAGIESSYIPGITSAQGAACSSGVPLTHRGLATGVRYVTGHRARDARLDLDWPSLASEDTTLVIYMGAMNMPEIAAQLMAHGMPATLPVMAIASATTPRERRLFSSLQLIATDLQETPMEAPVLFVVGHVVSLHPHVAASLAAPAKVAAHA